MIKPNARILKAHSHSHSMSGGSIWASLECHCCFLNSWRASVVPYFYLFIYLALPTRAGSPQQHMPITVGPFCLTHPVNFPCGRKPEYPEETHDFRQSVDFYSFHMRTGFESHWESSHWDLNLRPQRWKASALTTWPPKPPKITMWLLTLQLFKNSIDTREKLRLNLHSLSVSELFEYGRKCRWFTNLAQTSCHSLTSPYAEILYWSNIYLYNILYLSTSKNIERVKVWF